MVDLISKAVEPLDEFHLAISTIDSLDIVAQRSRLCTVSTIAGKEDYSARLQAEFGGRVFVAQTIVVDCCPMVSLFIWEREKKVWNKC